MGSNKRNKFSKEFVEEAIKDCQSIADFCRKVGWVPMGNNYKTFHKYVYEYGLDISHFTGQKVNLDGKLTKQLIKKSDEYLTEKSFKITSNKLLKKLLCEGKKGYKCECCGNSEWNGSQIPLELHHINGVHNDNRIENLMVLCPNCHAQTENYRGRNANLNRKIYHCEKCGKELNEKTKTGLCAKCYRDYERSKSKRPSKETLEQLYKEKSLTKIGLIYGVSDKTIKKWIIQYGIKNK